MMRSYLPDHISGVKYIIPFHCPQGWRHWRDFVDEHDTGQVGRGCGEMDAPETEVPHG